MTTLRQYVGSVPLFQSLYTAGLSARYARFGMPWTINGETYRIDPYHRHRLAHEYDAPVARYLRTRVQPGNVCIDVGANVGVYVLQFARWTGSKGHVYAFEPNPTARVVLDRHITWNEIAPIVTVVPLAVSDSPGTAVLHADGADGMARLGVPNRNLEGRTEAGVVNVTTLDDYCARQNISPDVVLIDVEGFELAALNGARDTLAKGAGRLSVVVEMHPDVWAQSGASRNKMESLFRERGYRAVPLTGQSDPLSEHGLVALEA